MFCSKCGRELREGAKFCAGCGAEVVYRDRGNAAATDTIATDTTTTDKTPSESIDEQTNEISTQESSSMPEVSSTQESGSTTKPSRAYDDLPDYSKYIEEDDEFANDNFVKKKHFIHIKKNESKYNDDGMPNYDMLDYEIPEDELEEYAEEAKKALENDVVESNEDEKEPVETKRKSSIWRRKKKKPKYGFRNE